MRRFEGLPFAFVCIGTSRVYIVKDEAVMVIASLITGLQLGDIDRGSVVVSQIKGCGISTASGIEF